MRFIYRSALLGLSSCAVESSVRGTARHSEDWLLKNILHGATETKGKPIIHSQVVVNLRVKRIRRFPQLGVLYIVVRKPLKIGIGAWYQRKDLLCDGADSIGANDVRHSITRKLLAAGTVCIARGRIIDIGTGDSHIAVAKCVGNKTMAVSLLAFQGNKQRARSSAARIGTDAVDHKQRCGA